MGARIQFWASALASKKGCHPLESPSPGLSNPGFRSQNPLGGPIRRLKRWGVRPAGKVPSGTHLPTSTCWLTTWGCKVPWGPKNSYPSVLDTLLKSRIDYHSKQRGTYGTYVRRGTCVVKFLLVISSSSRHPHRVGTSNEGLWITT